MDTSTEAANQKIYVGLATGEVTQFQLQDGDLIRVSTRPLEATANVTCGSVKSLAMHNSNVLIAWEHCLLEQEGTVFSRLFDANRAELHFVLQFLTKKFDFIDSKAQQVFERMT